MTIPYGYVQIASFSDRASALSLARQLRKQGRPARTQKKESSLLGWKKTEYLVLVARVK